MKELEIVTIPLEPQEKELESRCCPGEYIGCGRD